MRGGVEECAVRNEEAKGPAVQWREAGWSGEVAVCSASIMVRTTALQSGMSRGRSVPSIGRYGSVAVETVRAQYHAAIEEMRYQDMKTEAATLVLANETRKREDAKYRAQVLHQQLRDMTGNMEPWRDPNHTSAEAHACAGMEARMGARRGWGIGWRVRESGEAATG